MKKRLDGKKKLIALTSGMEADICQYCRENGVESESELIRQAIARFLDSGHSDDTLRLEGLQNIRLSLRRLEDMMNILFKYLHLMHLNILAYHPEIEAPLKDAALSSATGRAGKFFSGFQEQLRGDPPFFEKLLHSYVTGELDG
jgi:hypothetical protein